MESYANIFDNLKDDLVVQCVWTLWALTKKVEDQMTLEELET